MFQERGTEREIKDMEEIIEMAAPLIKLEIIGEYVGMAVGIIVLVWFFFNWLLNK